MKLGAQFYSLREECKTPEDLFNTMKKVKEIGYEVIQISGVCDIEAERLKSYIDELSLPVSCTHKPYDSIVNDTDNLIKYHKTIGCPVIGIGSMGDMRFTLEGVRHFIESIKEPIKKINDAGLNFAYHNHAFEFDVLDGYRAYDLLLEVEGLHFIHDVYWSTYAGEDPLKYVELLGREKRMTNIHFKDMKSSPKGDICACGVGVIDFKPIADLCKKYGIEYGLVEQDNAPDFDDAFEQMRLSYEHLSPIVK